MLATANGRLQQKQSQQTLLEAELAQQDLKQLDTNAKLAQPGTGLESVITQVTTRSDPPANSSPALSSAAAAAAAAAAANGDLDSSDAARENWRNRFKSIFCCFAPTANGYQRSTEVAGGDDPAALAALNIPVPPKWFRDPVIGPMHPSDTGKKTLVLDLDETLVHSSFKPIPNPDYIIPVDIEGRSVDVYVLKRPWLDHFMAEVGPRFEVVVFTASLAKYADPLLDMMDRGGVVRWRLFRESCCPYEGNYCKDLNCLGRDMASTIIVDNSPHSYVFQPFNAVPIGTFIDCMEDAELLEILPILNKAHEASDVRRVLGAHIPTWHKPAAAAAPALLQPGGGGANANGNGLHSSSSDDADVVGDGGGQR